MPRAHIINHTHWDREWFLTHEYTTAWIPALIDSLEDLAAENPDYEFLFDGQSLVIEDLMRTRPEYHDRVAALIGKGNLAIGPVYSQPDWRMVSGELHMRNLEYGVGDAEAFGGRADVAWLVDTFGHISQAPQMLRQAGVEAAYVWRGVPQMTPVFTWAGPDGTELPAIDLFGGYRNLYGITKTAEIAVDRLVAEVAKLAPAYGDLPIPLFDGYDLDTEPEDPVRYYETLDVPEDIEVVASSPRAYVDAVLPHLDGAPTIRGELLSGKFGSTFPGSLSSRTYLKLLHHDAEVALHRRVEPLAALAAAAGVADWDGERYEALSRELLQNGVHDCLCGVSIDQVHERMERSYRQIVDFADERQQDLAGALLDGFTPGRYAVSTAAWPMHTVLRIADAAVEIDTAGIGVGPVVASEPVETLEQQVDTFRFTNAHYDAVADPTNGLTVDGRPILRLSVVADAGDTYSSEPGETLGALESDGPLVLVDRTAVDEKVRMPMRWTNGHIDVRAVVEARFDQGPVIHLAVELDSDGTGFRVDAHFESGVSTTTAHASMPFDVVERPHEDRDLFGHDVDPAMAAILMGQRETGRVTEFPMHDFVALSSDEHTAAVLAKGVRSYRTDATGTITVTLRRAAEWLALTGLQLRSGDAGPMMYVPTARSERRIVHRLGYVRLAGSIDECGLHAINEGFHNPPLVVDVAEGPEDGPTTWNVFTATLPMTGLRRNDAGETVVRLWNPHGEAITLPDALALRSMRNADLGSTSELRPRQIVSVAVAVPERPATIASSRVDVVAPLERRGGSSRSIPALDELTGLDAKIEQLTVELGEAVAAIDAATGTDRWLATHRQYVIERELLELRLSRELNQRLRDSVAEVSIPDEADPIIAELGADLNDLRVKRRIYDYVVQALAPAE